MQEKQEEQEPQASQEQKHHRKQKTMDFTLRYPGYHDCPSCCRVRVWEEGGQPRLVLATELESNPGTSVTNRIEVIATRIFQMLERPEAGIIVIEHYEDRLFIGGKSRLPERFARVELTWTRTKGFVSPQWKYLSREDMERLIGGPLQEMTQCRSQKTGSER